MQRTEESTPSPNSSSFAGLLAALAAPPPKPESAWNDDGLADDVATLSYERALRAHARYKPLSEVNWPPPQPLVEASEQPPSLFSGLEPRTDCGEVHESGALRRSAAQAELDRRNLKTASITIRMSRAECAQLRRRAAEAGMSISAYLRSCTFEAEALRAQVKEALAQLRPAVPAKPPQSVRPWWSRIVPHAEEA